MLAEPLALQIQNIEPRHFGQVTWIYFLLNKRQVCYREHTEQGIRFHIASFADYIKHLWQQSMFSAFPLNHKACYLGSHPWIEKSGHIYREDGSK